MADPIHLHPLQAGANDPRRLNAFPGRHLGEREFDLRQAYADARLAPLLSARPPGVLDGLELSVTGEDADSRLHLRPGAGLGAGGQAVRLFFPLDQSWTSLVEMHQREHDSPPRDGFYFITVRRGVERVDTDPDSDPCQRTEPDPTRDARLETVGRLGLQFITANARWMAMEPTRAVNRLCVRHLRQSPFDPASGAVPVALVKIESGEPAWIDAVGGHIPARPDGPYQAFLAHTERVMAAFSRTGGRPPATPSLPPVTPPGRPPGGVAPRIPSPGIPSPGRPTPVVPAPLIGRPGLPGRLADIAGPPGRMPGIPADNGPRTLDALLGLDYLPAAGPLPASLVTDLASAEPGLAFEGSALQVELMPAPASTVPALLQRELTRGVVDLVHGRQDRIRVLAAIPDPDYRRDLMDLPRIDQALAEEMYRRGRAARAAHAAWLAIWQALFAGLGAEGLARAGAPGSERTGDGVGPGGVGGELPDNPSVPGGGTGAATTSGLPGISPPVSPEAGFQALVDRRRAQLGDSPLPEPYASHDDAPPPQPAGLPDPVTMPEAPGDGLHRQRELLRAEIDALEEELEENFNLLGELGDHLKLQRQQLDAITVSFSALAGGVPGDGSGLKLVRWSNAAQFLPITPSSDT